MFFIGKMYIESDVLTTLLTERWLSVCDVMDVTVILKFQNCIF